MPWARLDDGYFTNAKVAELSKDAKLLDLASIAFSARELRNGKVTRTDIRIIAAQIDIDAPFDIAHELINAGRWEMEGQATYVIHDYLDYNPSREQVLAERESNAERQARFREKHKETKQSPARNAVTTPVSNGTSTGRVTAAPYPVPVNAPNGAAVPESMSHETPIPKPIPKPNRSAEVIDAIRKRGVEPNLTDRDHAALKHTSAKPETIAEVYAAVYSGSYGDEFMQRHLSVREAIGWIDGYLALKNNGPPRTGRNGSGMASHHVPIDRTGRAN